MDNVKLQSFIDLVTFDQNLIQLKQTIHSADEKIKQLHHDLEQLQKSLEHKKSEKKELKKQFDLQELTVKDLQEKEKHQGTVVEATSTSKEFDAANKEFEHLKVERDNQEQRLMKLWNTLERVEKEVEDVRLQHEAKATEIQEAISKEQEVVQNLQQELDGLHKQRDTKVAVVPGDWISRYEHMRGKVSDPVVPVSQDSCAACFYSISSKDLQMLQQGELVQCKDCYRFLYSEKEDKEEK